MLRQSREDFSGFLDQSLQGDRPSAQLANHFDSILRYPQGRNLVGGCIFGNTALEMSDRNERNRGVIHGVFEEWRRRIREILERAVGSGEVRSGIDPEATARHIVATKEVVELFSSFTAIADSLRIPLDAFPKK